MEVLDINTARKIIIRDIKAELDKYARHSYILSDDDDGLLVQLIGKLYSNIYLDYTQPLCIVQQMVNDSCDHYRYGLPSVKIIVSEFRQYLLWNKNYSYI